MRLLMLIKHKPAKGPLLLHGLIFVPNFINPFEVEVKEDLFCISSSARAQAEVANDILNVEAAGKAAFKTFIQKRLVTKTLKSHASLLCSPQRRLVHLKRPIN